MEEKTTTIFSRNNSLEETIVIEEGYINDEEKCILLSLGKWDGGSCGNTGESFLLNKDDLKKLIDKLQFYFLRIGGYNG